MFQINIKSIFEVFSKRQQHVKNIKPRPLTSEFKTRILILCRDAFTYGIHGNCLDEFWQETHSKLQYLHGSLSLSGIENINSSQWVIQDVTNFLISCKDEHFLDFVEYIFQSELFWKVRNEDSMVKTVNHFFQIDDLPYFLTDFVKEQEQSDHGGITIRTTSYPQVIRKENDAIHNEAIEPVLKLLSDNSFKSANIEFLEALEDFRKGDYGDCLTKCGSSFESVMKIICEKKGWPYNQKDTSSRLLSTIINKSSLDSFFEQPLMIVATLRNRLSKSHGAGTEEKVVSKHLAQFAINSTASGILLLYEETR